MLSYRKILENNLNMINDTNNIKKHKMLKIFPQEDSSLVAYSSYLDYTLMTSLY